MEAFALSGCAGAEARFVAPENQVPAPTPPGWFGLNGLPTVVNVVILECEHLSLGRFERGPVTLVVESHEKFDAPESCRQGDYDYLNILTRMVWSDPEVADAVAAELGIVTSTATVAHEITGPNQAGLSTFEWQIGGSSSAVHFGRLENEQVESRVTFRYAWAGSEERLGLLDIHWDVSQARLEPSAVSGTFATPMLLADVQPAAMGLGAINAAAYPSGQIRFFEGNECSTPA